MSAGKLIPNLPTNFVVNDNAPYHNVLLERTPNSNSKKIDMMNWLSSHGILCSDDMFKPQLYRLIQIHKPRAQKYLVNHILSHTDTVFFAFHPTTQISTRSRWYGRNVSQWVPTRDVTFKTEDVKLLCEQKFSEMGEREWRLCVSVWKE
jgi:hypothetical protein